MIYFLLILTGFSYLYLLSGYLHYSSLHTAWLTGQGMEVKDEKAKFIFAKWTSNKLVKVFFNAKNSNQHRYKYYTAVYKDLAIFTGILTVACLFYALLTLWLQLSDNLEETSASILSIERSIHNIQAFIKPFKLSGIGDILVITLLAALAGSIPLLVKYKIKDKYGKAMKWLGYSMLVLTIFTSFTFFGSRFHKNETGRIGKLELHKLAIIKENKLLIHDIAGVAIEQAIQSYIGQPEVTTLVLNAITLDNELADPAGSDDSLAILMNIEQLRPLVTQKLNELIVSKTEDYNMDKTVIKADNSLAAHLEKNKTDVDEFIKKYAGTIHDNQAVDAVSSLTRFDNAIDNACIEALSNGRSIPDKTMSLGKIRHTRETFERVKVYFPNEVKAFGITAKFEESLRKTVKYGLGKTVNKWIGTFFEQMLETNPFFGNITDAIINDPLKEYLTKKTTAVISSCINNNDEDIIKELGTVKTDMADFFSTGPGRSEKLQAFSKKIEEAKTTLAKQKQKIFFDIYNAQQPALTHFKNIKSAGKFAALRNQFKQYLDNGYLQVTENGLAVMRDGFDKWEYYMERHKLEIGFSVEKDVEKYFASFCMNDPDMAATWGFIIIQDQAVQQEILNRYASKVATDGHIKPWHGLLYYYERLGYSEETIMREVVQPSNNQVGIICLSR